MVRENTDEKRSLAKRV
ncbi:Protein of unknown function, partial [Gryllus bimaculatus]